MSDKLLPTLPVGSYSRPSWLLEGLRKQKAGLATDEEICELKNQARLLTIKEIEDSGIDIVTDGEQGRTSFFEYLTEQLTGFVMDASTPFADGSRYVSLRRAVDKVQFKGEILAAREADFLKAHTSKPTKVAIISPTFLGEWWKSGGYYQSKDSFMEEVVRISQEEARALSGRADCVQWDAPGFASYTEPAISDAEARKLIKHEVEVLNQVVESVSYPPNTLKAVHVCWGNYKSTHMVDGPLLRILPELLDLKVDLLLLEMASASHEDDVEALKEYPSTKKIAAGVIDVKTPDVEPTRVVKKRIGRLLKYIDADKLLLTTDCGFAPTWDSDRIPRASCFLKLCSLALAAQEIRTTLTKS